MEAVAEALNSINNTVKSVMVEAGAANSNGKNWGK
jgi:hypothetical protein